MAVGIDNDAANIPNVNLVDQGSDPTTPAAGHVRLYTKSGVLYVRLDDGTVVAVGSVVTLAEGQLAIGDGSDELTALALGTEGQVVTADASGMAAWADATGGGGDVELIEDHTTGAGGEASHTFSGIAGTYKHLRLVITARTDRAGQTADTIGVRFNADTNANYATNYITATGNANPVAGESNSGTSAFGGLITGAAAAAGYPGISDLLIANYAATVFNKLFSWVNSFHWGLTTGLHRMLLGNGVWASTAAITSITLLSTSGSNFIEGSRFTLYGLK